MNYNTTEIWMAIALMTVIVVLTRNAFLLLPARLMPRGALADALEYAPLAALAAITAPDLVGSVMQDSVLQAPNLASAARTLWQDARLPALLCCFAVGFWRRSAVHGLFAGALMLVAIRVFS